MSFTLCFLITFTLFNAISCRDVYKADVDRIVTTSVGSFQGSFDIENGYYKFLGIPYGLVNEENPFGHSTAFPPIEDVFVANDDSVICPQVNSGVASGDKDCLNLRVYVPATATASSRLPVIFWIHGGYLMRGRASESHVGPKFLVRHDVIFVAINYRVGPFGFMCLGIDLVPGNQGLKDQRLALEWVKENIEAFGGNPDDITLAGSSAGAHSIDFHLHSEKDVLFNKIIMQSGNSLVETVLYEPDSAAAIRIAEHCGLQANSSREAVSKLAKVDAHLIVKAADELNIQFKPCVEAYFDDVDAFINRNWIHETPKKIANIPVLIGNTEFERLDSHINKEADYYENLDIFNVRLNRIFDFNNSLSNEGNRFERMKELVRNFYMGDGEISQDTVWSVVNFDSDFVYNHPTQRTIDKYLSAGAANVYNYMFSYSGERNRYVDHNNVPIKRAGHGDDTNYLFAKSSLPGDLSEQDQLIVDRMTAMWTNFVKYGDPTPEVTALLPVKWIPLTNEIHHFIWIDSDVIMDRRPWNRRMAFWDLFYTYNNEYQRIYDSFYAYDDDNDNDNGRGGIIKVSFVTLLSALVVIFFGQ